MNKITESVVWVGVNDYDVNLFEGQFAVKNGMAYNSYIIFDEKTVVMDSVDGTCTQKWLDNLENALAGKTPDYFVVSHMEPDHSASIGSFTKVYPQTKLVGNSKTFAMLDEYFPEIKNERVTVGDGESLSLGKKSLTFIFAPLVHWPEVMMSYLSGDDVLFSADAFGKFGTTDAKEDWTCEARRYYFGIVGKYGVQVQNVLKKLAGIPVRAILPLHGPMLTENIGEYVDKYKIWSSYAVESRGVAIAYASVYGNTEKAAKLLKSELEKAGCEKVSLCDLVRGDIHEAVEDAFRYGALVVCSPTYNGTIFPAAREFIAMLVERNYQNRKVGFIESGSWAPVTARLMKTEFEKCKNITFYSSSVKIRGAVSGENNGEIKAMADEIMSVGL